MDKEYMSRERAAEYLDVSAKTLERLAADGGGPPFIRIAARRVCYKRSDLDAWAASRRRKSLAHEAATAEDPDCGL